MQLLIRGFIFRMIFTGVGFLVSLLIAKLAGVALFGTFSFVIANAAFLYILTGLGTDAAIVWHGISGEEYNRNKVFSFTIRTALLQLLLFYALAIAVFFISGKSLLGRENGNGIFTAELIYFTGLVFTDKFLSLYYSQHEAKRCNKILAVCTSLLFLLLLLIGWWNVSLIRNYPVWVYSIFVFLPSLILVFDFLIKFKPVLSSISRQEFISFTSFSFVVFISNVIQFIAYRADFWFLKYYYGSEDLGIYAQASKFAQLLWIIPGIIAGLVIPALKNEKDKLTEDGLLSVSRLLLFSHLLLAIVLIFVSLFIYSFYLPKGFYDGFFALLIMIPGYLFYTIAIVLAGYFSAHRLLKVNLAGGVLCCTLMIVADVILIPTMGYKGAAIANLLIYFITTIFYLLRFISITKISPRQFFTLNRSDFNFIKEKL